MPLKFNPFSGNFDFAPGVGGTVFDGEVNVFSDLPETISNPPVNSAYLVRNTEGTIWFGNRKQKGIYIRSGNSGVRNNDWTYGGEYPVSSVNGETGAVTLDGSDIDTSANDDRAAFVVQSFADGNGIYYPLPDTTLNSKRVYRTTTGHYVFFENLRWHITDGSPNTQNIIESSDDNNAAWPWLSAWSGDVDKAHLADVVSRARSTFLFLGDNIPSTSVNGLATVAASGDYDDLSGKPASFTPTAHKNSHAVGQSDALAPSDIGAISQWSVFEETISASPTTLATGRARRITISTTLSTDTEVLLPTTGNQDADLFQLIRSGNIANGRILVKTVAGGSTLADLGTKDNAGRSFTFRWQTGGSFWAVVPVDAHAADKITSGTLDIARIPTGTSSTQVSLGNHSHGNLTSDGKLGSTAGLPVVTTTAGAVTTLALGTAGQVLTVNSGATGVEFAAASGGGSSIMQSIAVGFVLN